ncbi:MAG: hypothetical protein R3D71_05920 [Rickettsiales bacterium]
MIFPPDYGQEYKRRYTLLRKLKSDKKLQAALKSHYKNNPVDWINDWCVTYDPRNKPPLPKLMPFILFPRQVEFVEFLQECVKDGESGLIEKSRDMGATWLCCAYSVWLWIYIDGVTVGWGSRKGILVDRRGDPSSIFEKIRMIIEHLPSFILPEDFSIKKHAAQMNIRNPINGSVIAGESGDEIGRGGRSTIYFKDESAHYERPEKIEAALGDNTDVQIDISSVLDNTLFQRRREAGEEWSFGKKIEKGVTRVFILDWRHHPAKDQKWYDRRRKKAEDEGMLHIFAQEVDRDYTATRQGIIIPSLWVKASIDAHVKLGFNEDGIRIAAQDIADEGGDQNALAIAHGSVVIHTDVWGEGDAGQTTRRSIAQAKLYGVKELYYDSIGVGAGFKSESNRMVEEKRLNPKKLRVMAWNATHRPLDPKSNLITGDRESPTNEEFFLNLKAQSWWRLRVRFEKTYKAITQGAVYSQEEMISLPSDLPNLEKLLSELSQAIHKTSLSGKMMVDKKPAGGRSPNIADAVVMAFNPEREISILDVL